MRIELQDCCDGLDVSHPAAKAPLQRPAVQRHSTTGAKAPTVVVYHNLSDATDPLTNGLGVNTAPDRFRAHIKYLAKHYDLIGPSDLVTGRLPTRPLLVTFDDTYRSVMEVAGPILREVNAPSILFTNPHNIVHETLPFDNLIAVAFAMLGSMELVRHLGLLDQTYHSSAAFITRYASRISYNECLDIEEKLLGRLGCSQADMRRQSSLFLNAQDLPRLQTYGIELGNHSMTHRFFRNLPPHQLDVEIAQSRRLLELMSGEKVRYLAIPYGHETDATDQVVRMARASGHDATFLVQARCNHRRPAPDIYYRIGPGDVRVEFLPLVLKVLPRLRTWKQMT